MDRLIYIAMNGANHTMHQQAQVAHNLANASTTGYKAEANSFRALPVLGEGAQTRTFVVDSTSGADFSTGAILNTDRDLDVAVQGKGWIAVQAADGSEAYTRNGSLLVGANGLLQTRNGLTVMGDGGPLAVPPDAEVTIAKDGTVSIIPAGQAPNTVATVGRVKLVNPPETDLIKSGDGLFRLSSGLPAPADANVVLAQKSLETSNVNAVDSLVSMISLARQYDMQIKLLQNAEANAQKANQIMSLNG
ncbi:flagellar basal-body rod protein FlgF [Sulfuricella denitrificans skB26]|uniref:Flagellar basal-body rod protein FlgF n=1 Tax=Sulfuricella denitrificans (strain DSM 22764 / NBRC 105220 / skB26) TaxID=1163617 RepID=S6AHA0_SULDS|nr:flagellar basal-body rod protein FlgF [Sulfuricella denitrificans]BAN35521.1 flagellar basal-body rod protein FlgF [Sulfuricella denitrificans skB26]